MALAAGASLTLSACSSSLPKSVSSAPVLSVVTALWPLASAATEIGGDKAAVDDLVPPGTDPFTYRPGPAGERILQSAGLVVEIGGGFQPAVEEAARDAPKVLRLGPDPATGDPYVWMDPGSMASAVKSIADAMAAANPPAAPLYERNVGALQDSIRSLGIDYESTLSTCPGNTLVTPDLAFSAMAAEYRLQNHVVAPAPTPEQIANEKAALSRGGPHALLRQPWVDNSGVEEVAAATGSKVHAVDTLAGAPVGGTPPQNTYMARMEQVLGVLSGALRCSSAQQ